MFEKIARAGGNWENWECWKTVGTGETVRTVRTGKTGSVGCPTQILYSYYQIPYRYPSS